MDKIVVVDWYVLCVFYFLRYWLNSFWGEFGFIFYKFFEMWVGWFLKWNDYWVKKNWIFFIFVYVYDRKCRNVFWVFFLYKIYCIFYNKLNYF